MYADPVHDVPVGCPVSAVPAAGVRPVLQQDADPPGALLLRPGVRPGAPPHTLAGARGPHQLIQGRVVFDLYEPEGDRLGIFQADDASILCTALEGDHCKGSLPV